MTVLEAAKQLAVSRMAIYDWIDKEKLRVVSTGERKRGKGLRVNSEDVARLRQERLEELRAKLGQVQG